MGTDVSIPLCSAAHGAARQRPCLFPARPHCQTGRLCYNNSNCNRLQDSHGGKDYAQESTAAGGAALPGDGEGEKLPVLPIRDRRPPGVPAPDAVPARLHPKKRVLFTQDSLQWLESLQDSSVDLVFADPPYNVRKADWDRFDSQEQYIRWSMQWIAQAARILKPTAASTFCGFSEILADLKHPAMQYFSGCRWLIWHYRNKANLGKDWGRSHESILHFRKTSAFQLNIDQIRIPYSRHTLKYPKHPQAQSSQYSGGSQPRWCGRPIPWGPSPRTCLRSPPPATGWGRRPPPHPEAGGAAAQAGSGRHQAGGHRPGPLFRLGHHPGGAQQLQRLWIGCEKEGEYNTWAMDRIDRVPLRPVEAWMELDRENARRRESIR